MTAHYYLSHPELQTYFSSLPQPVQTFILQSGVEFSTLGELMQCAEHLQNNDYGEK